MDIKNMITFLKVAEFRSFSQAAELLGYSQSAVSTQILKLENELGNILFDRIGHKIYLTESGRRFQEYVQRVLILTENLEHDLEGNQELYGTIRIATSDSLCYSLFTSIIIEYQRQYPNVQIHISTGLTDDMLLSLSHNDIDLVYTLDTCVRRPDLIVVKESPEQANFYASTAHPIFFLPQPTIEELKKYPLYLTEQGVSYRKLLDQILAQYRQDITPSLESGNVQVIRDLILQTNGIGFVPEFVTRTDVSNGRLRPISIPNLKVTVWKQLIHHKGKALTPAMNAFISFLP